LQSPKRYALLQSPKQYALLQNPKQYALLQSPKQYALLQSPKQYARSEVVNTISDENNLWAAAQGMAVLLYGLKGEAEESHKCD
jgi:hypothetical protein